MTSEDIYAKCEIYPNGGTTVSGQVRLVQPKLEHDGFGRTQMYVELNGLKPGAHGFHIHELSESIADGCDKAGAIYNPFRADFG